MRALWTGSISFGLVAIPVQLFPATEEKTVAFHQLHKQDGARVRYRKVCAADGKELGADDIIRGYEYEKQRYITVTEAEMTALPLASRRVIDIAAFVSMEEIDPVYFKRSYFLAPEKAGGKAYRLLSDVLKETRRLAVAKVAFRDKEHLAAIRPQDGLLMLHTMYWPDELREAAQLTPAGESAAVRPQELDMAKMFVDSLTEPWNAEAFKDEYREALRELLRTKAEGGEVEAPAVPQPGGEVVDLMAALRSSVESVKKKRAAG